MRRHAIERIVLAAVIVFAVTGVHADTVGDMSGFVDVFTEDGDYGDCDPFYFETIHVAGNLPALFLARIDLQESCDYDGLRFELASDRDVTIVTNSTGDTTIQLYECDTDRILGCDDDSNRECASGLCSQISGCLRARRSYCVRVRPFSAGSAFDYELEIQDNGGCTAQSPPVVTSDRANACADPYGRDFNDSEGCETDSGGECTFAEPTYKGACCLRPPGERVCDDYFTRGGCAAAGGVYEGDWTDCGIASLCDSTIEVSKTCTLVDAIRAANNDDDGDGLCPPGGAGFDTVILNDDVSLTAAYENGAGLPTIESDVAIDGQGFTIERAASASEAFRLLNVRRYARLTVRDTVLSNGNSDTDGGAILNRGTTLIVDSVLSGNRSSEDGGAIANLNARITIVDSEVTGNSSGRAGGGMFTSGFRFDLRRNWITNSTFSGNEAVFGGGIATGAGVAKSVLILPVAQSTIVTDSTFTGNLAHEGGGIFNGRDTDFDILRSTLSNNVATGSGGGLFTNGYAIVSNSSLSGNTATLSGGGIFNDAYAILDHNTLFGNSAGDSGAGFFGDHYSELRGNIVAGNSPGADCAGSGAFREGADNFDGDGSCPDAAPITPGVDFDTALADNGGPTPTHALFDGSVARDAAGDCDLDTDQRGLPREDGACDSGSFEIHRTGACCLAPNSQRICSEGFAVETCEAAGGLYAGDGTACSDPLLCDALLVTLDALSAVATATGVEIRWTTALEIDTVAFRVLRESGRREKALQLVGETPAAGSDVEGQSYSMLDDAPEAVRARRYYLEDIDVYGKVTRHGPIVVERSGRTQLRNQDSPAQRDSSTSRKPPGD